MNATQKGIETMINAQIANVKFELSVATGSDFRELRRLVKVLEAAKNLDVYKVIAEFKSEDVPNNGVSFETLSPEVADLLGKASGQEVVRLSLHRYYIAINLEGGRVPGLR
jgi:hypothetical protein